MECHLLLKENSYFMFSQDISSFFEQYHNIHEYLVKNIRIPLQKIIRPIFCVEREREWAHIFSTEFHLFSSFLEKNGIQIRYEYFAKSTAEEKKPILFKIFFI